MEVDARNFRAMALQAQSLSRNNNHHGVLMTHVMCHFDTDHLDWSNDVVSQDGAARRSARNSALHIQIRKSPLIHFPLALGGRPGHIEIQHKLHAHPYLVYIGTKTETRHIPPFNTLENCPNILHWAHQCCMSRWDVNCGHNANWVMI